MNITFKALLALVLLFPVTAMAQEESPLYAEVTFSDYHSSDGDTLAQEVYLDYSVSETISVWGDYYHIEGYSSMTAGVAYNWDNGWTTALGVGSNRYDGESHRIITPWVSYNSDEWALLASAEYYSGGDSPFYQGYMLRRLSEHWDAGVYGETDFCVGPMVGYRFNEHLLLRVSVPVADKSDAKILGALVLTF